MHKCTSCGYEYEISDGGEDWEKCPNCDLHYKHRKFDFGDFVQDNISINSWELNSILIKCGHGRAGDHVICLRQENPRILYLCCLGCYHMISGDMIERAFKVKGK